MAAPSVAAAGVATGYATASVTASIPFPASVTANDVALMFVIATRAVTGQTLATISTPAGWNLHPSTPFLGWSSTAAGDVVRGYLFWKRCSGSEGGTSVTVTRSTSSTFIDAMGRIFLLRGAGGGSDNTSPWWEDAAVNLNPSPGSDTWAWNSVTVSGSERTLLAFAGKNDDAPNAAALPSGYAQTNAGGSTTTTGQDAAMGLSHSANVSAGSYSTSVVAVSLNTDGWATLHIAAIPTASGTTQLLSGVTAGTSSATGAIEVTKALSGSSAGVATGVGVVVVTKQLAGVSGGVAAPTGVLLVTKAMSGVTAGQATAAGAVEVTKALAGLSAGAAAPTGALVVSKELSGVSTGATSLVAMLVASKELSGLSGGGSTAAADILVTKAMTGVSTGIGAASAALLVTKEMSGLSAGVADASASMAVTQTQLLSGQSAGQATASGAIQAVKELVGSSAGSAIVSAVIQAVKQLSGSSSGTATAEATIDPSVPQLLAGLSRGASSAFGTLMGEVRTRVRGAQRFFKLR